MSFPCLAWLAATFLTLGFRMPYFNLNSRTCSDQSSVYFPFQSHDAPCVNVYRFTVSTVSIMSSFQAPSVNQATNDTKGL